MPLLDHFHPPLSTQRHWEGFHSLWASSIAAALNDQLLPPGYFAEVQIHVGSRLEVDVASFEEESVPAGGTRVKSAAATLPARIWAPPTPSFVMPAIFPDSLEVIVFHDEGGPNFVAAVELVCPGNKDRPAFRNAFACKCASYLQQGIGLIILDVVTSLRANLHDELVRLIDAGDTFLMGSESLYAVSYRPVRKPDADSIEVWRGSMQVGQALPLLPLALDKGICIPLDFEAIYREACERSRLTG